MITKLKCGCKWVTNLEGHKEMLCPKHKILKEGLEIEQYILTKKMNILKEREQKIQWALLALEEPR